MKTGRLLKRGRRNDESGGVVGLEVTDRVILSAAVGWFANETIRWDKERREKERGKFAEFFKLLMGRIGVQDAEGMRAAALAVGLRTDRAKGIIRQFFEDVVPELYMAGVLDDDAMTEIASMIEEYGEEIGLGADREPAVVERGGVGWGGGGGP